MEALSKVSYNLSLWTTGTPDSAFANARRSGSRSACGLIDAAIYELELSLPADEPLDQRAYDPELWSHIEGPLTDEDWGKVDANVSIFVEDRVRISAGRPRDKNGEDLPGLDDRRLDHAR